MANLCNTECRTMQNTEYKSKFQNYGNRCDNAKTWRSQSNENVEENGVSKVIDSICTENWRNTKENTLHKNVKINDINNENNSYKKENFSSPLIGYTTEEERGSADWESIEIANIETLLASSKDIKFFRITIDKDSMKESMQSSGSLHVPYDIYQMLKQCPTHYTIYLLLEECSELQWRTKQLVGIAKICDLSFDKNKIRVNYLSLSKTEIQLQYCDENNLMTLKPIFTSYIALLKAKSLQPLLPDISPWLPIQPPTLPTSKSSSIKPPTLPTSKSSDEVEVPATQLTLDDINHSIAKKWKVNKDKEILNRSRSTTEHTYTEEDIQALTELYESKCTGTEVVETCATEMEHQEKNVVGSLNNNCKNSQESRGSCINSVKSEVVDLMKTKMDKDEDEHNAHKIPPLQGLFNSDKSLNIKPWQTIEYENLNQIADFTDRRFFMCDIELESIYKSFGNGGLLVIKKELYENIPDMQPNPTYLVLRKNNVSTEFKPVIGVAKVVYKIKNDIQVQVSYLSISRAQYVLNPWGEDDVFSDGAEIVCLEDIKILLDEYKMSARHKKVQPLFDYVYPWSGAPPVMNPQQPLENGVSKVIDSKSVRKLSGAPPVMNPQQPLEKPRMTKNSNSSNTMRHNGVDNVCNGSAINDLLVVSNCNEVEVPNSEPLNVNHTSNNRNVMDRMIKNSLGVPCSSNTSPGNNNKNGRTGNKNNVNFSPVEQCITIDNSKDNTHNELEWLESSDNEFKVEETDSVPIWDGNFAKASVHNSIDSDTNPLKSPVKKPYIPVQSPKLKPVQNIMSPKLGNISHRPTICSRNLAGSKLSDKSKLPPLRGLFISGTKTVTNQSWEEIERNNLSYISQPGSINEFFLCNTDMSTIRKSFREGNLEVSAKNMENIASLGRVRKLFILRAQISNPNKFVVIGIAMVNPSAGVAKDEKSDKYSAKVSYLCLSTFPGNIFAASQGDGVEVFAHVSSGFIQQYMLALRQRTVRPLFPNIYPWNSYPAAKGEPIGIPSPSSPTVKCDDVPNPIESNINRLTDSYEDDLFPRYESRVTDETISFQQIDNELCQAGEKSIEYEPISVPVKAHVKKEIVQNRMKQYSTELSRILSKSDGRSSYDSRKSVVQKKLFDIPDKSVNGVQKGPGTKTSRGRGRGMIILQMANASSS